MAKARYKRGVKKAVQKAAKEVKKAAKAKTKATAATLRAAAKVATARPQRTLFNPWAWSRPGWIVGGPTPTLGRSMAFSRAYVPNAVYGLSKAQKRALGKAQGAAKRRERAERSNPYDGVTDLAALFPDADPRDYAPDLVSAYNPDAPQATNIGISRQRRWSGR